MKSSRETKAVCSALDTATPEMDDDDGFTMVDETFGVREPSECSDQEEEEQEKNPPSPRLQKKLEPVQLGQDCSFTAPMASTSLAPLPTGSDKDKSRIMLTALSGIGSVDRRGGIASKRTSRGSGVLAMLRRGINADDGRVGVTPSSDKKPSTWLRDLASTPTSTSPDRERCHQDIPGLGAIPPGPSALLTSRSAKTSTKNADSTTEKVHTISAAKIVEASTSIFVPPPPASAATAAMTATSPPRPSAAPPTTLNSGAGAPPSASSGKAIGCDAANINTANPAKQQHAMTKALTIRLVPGDCAFCAVVPRTGRGSIATVTDIKSEIERKLGLRTLVDLSFVVVREQRGLSPMFIVLFLRQKGLFCFIVLLRWVHFLIFCSR